jgi:hypothetical protein
VLGDSDGPMAMGARGKGRRNKILMTKATCIFRHQKKTVAAGQAYLHSRLDQEQKKTI